MKPRILFIDNDTEMSELYRLNGESAGFETKVCTSGLDGLKYLNDGGEADAIILDLAMPGLDGLTVAEEIRRNEEVNLTEKPVHIFFITAYDVDETIRRVGQNVRVEKIYRKPCHLDAMLEEVRQRLTN